MKPGRTLAWLVLMILPLVGASARATTLGLRPIEGDFSGSLRSALARGLQSSGLEVALLGQDQVLSAPSIPATSSRSLLVFDISLPGSVTLLALGEQIGDAVAQEFTEEAGAIPLRVHPSLNRNIALIRRAVKIERTVHEGELALPMSRERAQLIGRAININQSVFGYLLSSSYDADKARTDLDLVLSRTQTDTGEPRPSVSPAPAAAIPAGRGKPSRSKPAKTLPPKGWPRCSFRTSQGRPRCAGRARRQIDPR